MKLLLTGATSYIGQRFLKSLLAEGVDVVVATRRAVPDVPKWIPYDLSSGLLLSPEPDIDVIVHLAAETGSGVTSEISELTAAKKMIETASSIGARFVFVSSQSAAPDAPTRYGRVKWQIEQETIAARGIVVRLGQVYGGQERGLFGILTGSVRKLPILPDFFPRPIVQPIHVDDCVEGLLKLVKTSNMGEQIFVFASPCSVPFTRFLKLIAKERCHLRRFFVPIPVPFVKLFSRLLGISLSTRLGLSRLESLFALQEIPSDVNIELLQLNLRPLSSGMHRSGSNRRRRLLIEARAVLSYILKTKPENSLEKRYVRSIEALKSGEALGVPPWMANYPSFLAVLDVGAQTNSEVRWRIRTAMVLAEASVQGGNRFLPDAGHTNPLLAFSQMLLPLFNEASARFVALLVVPRVLKKMVLDRVDS